MTPKPKAVLFDLDGTLIDTAPDLAACINRLLEANNRPTLSFDTIRPVIAQGTQAMVSLGFSDNLDAQKRNELRHAFLADYANNFAIKSKLFNNMDTVLNTLGENNISWGVVTNKHARFAKPLMHALDLDTRCAVLVCGDTLHVAKPAPDPILHACKQLNISPAEAVYVGDTEGDIIAARNANMPCIAVSYGYIDSPQIARAWHADAVIDTPLEILSWLHLN